MFPSACFFLLQKGYAIMYAKVLSFGFAYREERERAREHRTEGSKLWRVSFAEAESGMRKGSNLRCQTNMEGLYDKK